MSMVHSHEGTTIAFDRSAGRSPVILVGGALQHRALDPRTARLSELLAKRFPVLGHDCRAGDSGAIPPYQVERAARRTWNADRSGS